jgi:hypothetical protein
MVSSLMAAHFVPVKVVATDTMTVVIPLTLAPAPTVNGSPIIAGDEVAVYSPGGLCAGFARWPSTGASFQITVYGDVNFSNSDAMHPNDLLYFKVWDSTAAKEVPATVTFATGQINNYTNTAITTPASLIAQSAPSQLTLTSPKGGENWYVGSTHTITWTSTETTTGMTVRIELSQDNGLTWTRLTANPTVPYNGGSYSWTISNTILGGAFPNSLCRIRITPTTIPNDPGDFSEGAFTLSPRINITAPGTDTVLIAGSASNVVFSVNGAIGNVAIEYTLDGATWTAINTGRATTNPSVITQAWTLPTTISKKCNVRVYKTFTGTTWPAGNPADTSGAFIIAPSITITAPATASHKVAGASDTIKWDAVNSSGKFKIEYSINANANAPTWTAINASVLNVGKYPWTIPNTPSIHCKVRFSDTAVNVPSAITGEFIIDPAPALSLTVPDSGQVWAQGSTHDITWISVGTVGNLKIEYRTKPSDAWRPVIASTANDGRYTWTIPATVSDSCKVRISDAADAAVLDTSRSLFSIAPPTLTLQSPKGGEKWATGTQHPITWQSDGAVGNIKIELSTDDAAWTVIIASTANNGTFTWTIPENATLSAKCKVRISQITTGTPVDSGRAYFEIVSGATPTVSLTFPNDKVTWFTGTSMPITWTSTGAFDSVKLEYTINNADWRSIRNVANGGGKYSWDVPDTVSPSIHCSVRITGIVTSGPTDKSAAEFTLVAPAIKIAAPNGGEAWNSNTANSITWGSDSIVGKVKIEYTTNNGRVWVTIADSAANNKGGSFPWTLPTVLSDSCKVKISAVTRRAVFGVSNKFFSIIPAPSISLASPMPQQKFHGGDSAIVLWTSYDVTGKVKIEYSKNNGATWATLKDSVDVALGRYTWNIPKAETPSDSCKVRVGSIALSGVIANSGVFSIEPSTATGIASLQLCKLKADLCANRAGIFIRIGVPQAGPVDVRVFDMMGREIARMQSGNTPAGYHTLSIPAAQLTSGWYMANVSIGAARFIKAISYTK